MQSPDPKSDSWLDDQLRAVPLPEGFVDRLRWAALVDDDDLDEALRDVPLPAGLLDRLRLPRRRFRLANLVDMATAATLLLGIGVSYVGAMALFLLAAYTPSGVSRPELHAQLDIKVSPQAEDSPLVFLVVGDSVELAPPLPSTVEPLPSVSINPAEYAFPQRLALTEMAEMFLLRADGVGATQSTFFPVSGSHNLYDELDDLEKVPGLSPRGIDPPLVRGYPLKFFLQYGVTPFVFPGADPKLQHSDVPLSVDSSSYDLTRRYLNDGMLPAAKVVRTEEFLAALYDVYDFPAPEQQGLNLTMVGGPSPFGGNGVRLLQIGVRASPFRDVQRQPAHLVLAVDVSASMRWGGRLAMVRRSLNELMARLGPGDRISVVIFSEAAHVLIENANRDDAEQVLPAIESLSPESSTNIGAGLRKACAVAQYQAAEQQIPATVVLLTDGLGELNNAALGRIGGRLADAADHGIRLDVVDLGQENESDHQLQVFAEAAGGKIHRASTADGVCWAMLEILTGRSQLAAADARLRVTFNPKTVLEYRLLGHEARALAGLLPAKLETDFHCGQSATVLYEVRLKPVTGGEVARADLHWNNPKGDGTRSLSQSIGPAQFGSSLPKSPLSLQAAAIAAETAEILRGSPFVDTSPKGKSGALARLLYVAGQVDTPLFYRADFMKLIATIKQAQQAKPYRSGGKR